MGSTRLTRRRPPPPPSFQVTMEGGQEGQEKAHSWAGEAPVPSLLHLLCSLSLSVRTESWTSPGSAQNYGIVGIQDIKGGEGVEMNTNPQCVSLAHKYAFPS